MLDRIGDGLYQIATTLGGVAMAGTILCCVDGSAHCRRAVEVSVDLAKGMNRDLAFVAVNQVRPASGFPPIRAWTEEEAARVLDVAARYAESHGLRKV